MEKSVICGKWREIFSKAYQLLVEEAMIKLMKAKIAKIGVTRSSRLKFDPFFVFINSSDSTISFSPRTGIIHNHRNLIRINVIGNLLCGKNICYFTSTTKRTCFTNDSIIHTGSLENECSKLSQLPNV